VLAALSVDGTQDFHISSLTLSQQRYRAALPTKIQRSLDRTQDQQGYIGTEGRGPNTGPSYIQSNAVLTKIQRKVDGTHYLHIFSILSEQIYRDNPKKHT